MSKDTQAIIIDLGHGSIKAGFSGEIAPSCVVPTIFGSDGSVGDDALSRAGALNLENPLDGDELNSEKCQKLLSHVFNQLHQDPSGCSIVISEPFGNPSHNREVLSQLVFETFSASSLYIASSAALDAFSHGFKTAMIVNSGDRFTQFVPIYDGWQMPDVATKIEFGGRNVTKYLAELLSGQKAFSTPSELEIVRDMKEKHCYVAANYEPETKKVQHVSYDLPSAVTIDLGIERLKCTELMFQPSLAGLTHPSIASLCHETLAKVGDAGKRKQMSAKIILCGGNTLFQGFHSRFSNEMTKLGDTVLGAGELSARYTTFCGGSILARHPNFETLPVTRSEYQSEGFGAITRKFKSTA